MATKRIRKINMDEATIRFYKTQALRRIASTAYEKYRFLWFYDHYYSLDEIFDEMKKFDSYEEFEQVGMYGEIYACYKEFLSNEFLDEKYMKTLLEPKDYRLYKSSSDLIQELKLEVAK